MRVYADHDVYRYAISRGRQDHATIMHDVVTSEMEAARSALLDAGYDACVVDGLGCGIKVGDGLLCTFVAGLITSRCGRTEVTNRGDVRRVLASVVTEFVVGQEAPPHKPAVSKTNPATNDLRIDPEWESKVYVALRRCREAEGDPTPVDELRNLIAAGVRVVARAKGMHNTASVTSPS